MSAGIQEYWVICLNTATAKFYVARLTPETESDVDESLVMRDEDHAWYKFATRPEAQLFLENQVPRKLITKDDRIPASAYLVIAKPMPKLLG